MVIGIAGKCSTPTRWTLRGEEFDGLSGLLHRSEIGGLLNVRSFSQVKQWKSFKLIRNKFGRDVIADLVPDEP